MRVCGGSPVLLLCWAVPVLAQQQPAPPGRGACCCCPQAWRRRRRPCRQCRRGPAARHPHRARRHHHRGRRRPRVCRPWRNRPPPGNTGRRCSAPLHHPPGRPGRYPNPNYIISTGDRVSISVWGRWRRKRGGPRGQHLSPRHWAGQAGWRARRRCAGSNSESRIYTPASAGLAVLLTLACRRVRHLSCGAHGPRLGRGFSAGLSGIRAGGVGSLARLLPQTYHPRGAVHHRCPRRSLRLSCCAAGCRASSSRRRTPSPASGDWWGGWGGANNFLFGVPGATTLSGGGADRTCRLCRRLPMRWCGSRSGVALVALRHARVAAVIARGPRRSVLHRRCAGADHSLNSIEGSRIGPS